MLKCPCNKRKINVNSSTIADRTAVELALLNYNNGLNVDYFVFNPPRQILQSSASLIYAIDCEILNELTQLIYWPGRLLTTLALLIPCFRGASHPAKPY